MKFDSSNVVILTINGHDGRHGGMEKLRDKLRALLGDQFDIPHENIMTASWNDQYNATSIDDPTAFTRDPDIPNLVSKLKTASSDPEYVVLIGHSYGGRAACMLSNELEPLPNYVALLDPVFGATNHEIPNGEAPKAHRMDNWYQTHGIGDWNPCLIVPDLFDNPLPFSMGYSDVPGANNQEVNYRRKWNGKVVKKDCGLYKAKEYLSHTNIDDDRRLWRLIYQTILGDIE